MGPASSETLAREDRSPNSNSKARGGVAITTGARSLGGGSDESGLAVVGTRDPGSVLTGQTVRERVESERGGQAASEAGGCAGRGVSASGRLVGRGVAARCARGGVARSTECDLSGRAAAESSAGRRSEGSRRAASGRAMGAALGWAAPRVGRRG